MSMSSGCGRGKSPRANSGALLGAMDQGGSLTEGEDEDSCIDRAGRHGGRRRAGVYEQRLQEEPAQLMRPDLKHPTSLQELIGSKLLLTPLDLDRLGLLPFDFLFASRLRQAGLAPPPNTRHSRGGRTRRSH